MKDLIALFFVLGSAAAAPWFPPYSPGFYQGGYGGYGGYFPGFPGFPGYYGYGYGYPGNYGVGAYGGGFGGYGTGHKVAFYGEFKGQCEGSVDGLYYVDDRSFAFCHSGQKTIQPCAEGSANPPYDNFQPGHYYAFYDFCSVNLMTHDDPRYETYPTYDDKHDSYASDETKY